MTSLLINFLCRKQSTRFLYKNDTDDIIYSPESFRKIPQRCDYLQKTWRVEEAASLGKISAQCERINLSSIQHEVSVKWSDECGSHYSTYARIEFFLIRVTRVTARSKDQAKH